MLTEEKVRRGKATRSLTPRQRDIIQGITARKTLKMIAADLNISLTRVNQHVTELKAIFGGNSLAELAEKYRAASAAPGETHCTKDAWTKNQLPPASEFDQQGCGTDGNLVLADAMHFHLEAPWRESTEPAVFPGELDGSHTAGRRLWMMLGLSLALTAGLILAIVSAVTVGNVLNGVATIPDRAMQKPG